MREFYQKYQDYMPAVFFAGGFLFDLITTDRIDQTFSLVQQASYLFLIFIFLYWEVVTPRLFLQENSKLALLWKYHISALHFLFGSLLSLYTIFYFKSASLVTSFIFLALMVGLLIINELPHFQRQGFRVRSSIFALSLSSYFIYLVPVVTGEIGWVSFLLAMVLSIALFLYLCVIVFKKRQDASMVREQILVPGLIIQMVFVLLYFFKVLPPVPLSLQSIGIYHDVKKYGGQYQLRYERSWWRFWQSGAQTFFRRDGDKVYCFVRIFSPTRFKDNIQILWLQDRGKGWQKVDRVDLPIVGGRDQGFRGYAYKSNFTDGDWQVRVLTSDAREIGRLSFEVITDNTTDPRDWRQDLY